MTTLTPNEVQKIAELSKLSLPAEQFSVLTERLESVLNLVKKMNTVDTDSIKPLAHPLNVTQPLRADTVTESNQRELFQTGIAPQVESGLYIVPKFVESE